MLTNKMNSVVAVGPVGVKVRLHGNLEGEAEVQISLHVLISLAM